MEPLSEIKENIRKIAGRQRQVIFTAKVVSVDGEVCTVEVDGLRISDVRLRSVINGENSKLLITPKQDSYVTVVDTMGDMCSLVVIAYSEIDHIDIDSDNVITINGGKNGGLVTIQELTDQLNELVKWCREHTHSGEFDGTIGGQPATGTLTIAASTPGPENFDKGGYENINIKH